MNKKSRLPFSALSKEGAKEHGGDTKQRDFSTPNRAGGEHKHREHSGSPSDARKKNMKSSTYQYSKFGKGGGRGGRSFGTKPQNRNTKDVKIPPPEEGVIPPPAPSVAIHSASTYAAFPTAAGRPR